MPKTAPHPTMTHAMHLVLLALLPGDRHGYAIMLSVEELTQGESRLGPATLYTSIRKLLELGLVAESGERPDASIDDERRRYYHITAAGKAMAAAENNRLERLVRYARRHRLGA